jgi:Ser/Thr protein kinase RdoA (MazF antagonist)
MRTFNDMAAIRAKLHAVKSSAIEEQQRLFAFVVSILDRVEQFLAKMGKPIRAIHGDFHIDNLNGWQRSRGRSLF